MSNTKICRQWGRNQGRWLTWSEEHELEKDLDRLSEDLSTTYAQGRAMEIRRKVLDFGWSTSNFDQEPGDPDMMHLLILPTDDWNWIDSYATRGFYVRVEVCAPSDYQGWEVDAGLTE